MESFLNILSITPWWGWLLLILFIVAIYDIFLNRKHTILHNFPVVGHIRYFLESFGPELRQYIVASNREELPFNRRERGWIYASSKNENNYEGFGTDQDMYSSHYIFIKNAIMPYRLPDDHPNKINSGLIPCAKLMGAYNKRARPYRPASIINVSAMSYGSLSARAIEALNEGCKLSGAYHNTGEGGLSPYHKKGADVIFQIGTAYFGTRDEFGNFQMAKLIKIVKENPQVRAVEIKLSQGAKPGKGGVLPAKKISSEISEIRGVPMGKAVISPSYHSAFNDLEGMISFIEEIAAATGLPVGIKAAVGNLEEWHQLAKLMKDRDQGPDFITIDGGEGGTGAAPPSFADHVSVPWIYGFSDVYKIFQEHHLTDRIVFVAAGKLGFPAKAAMAFSLGADCINVGREAMMSIGCIQAQSCHTNTCPTGIATQNKWLQRGIHVPDKAMRTNFYFVKFRKELLQITHACGYEHPAQFSTNDIEINLSDKNLVNSLESTFGYTKDPVNFESIPALVKCPHLGGNLDLKTMRKTEDAIH